MTEMVELQSVLLDRLEGADLEESRFELALAAVVGELQEYFEGEAVEAPDANSGAAVEPAGVYLTSIGAEGFRGIGPASTIELEPGPGLTLVVGRNGSGKSSFAEALELLMTGENHRWSGARSKKWEAGWKNLHHGAVSSLAAALHIDGVGSVSLVRDWPEGASLDDGTTRISMPSGSTTTTELGWDQALAVHRPFLPYNELGSVLEEGPTKLHDAVEMVLGLEGVKPIREEVDSHRKEFEARVKAVKSDAATLIAELEEVDDDRARRAVDAIRGRRWDLDLLDELVKDSSASAPASDDIARNVLALPLPDRQAIGEAAEALLHTADQQRQMGDTDAGQANRLADLLEAAMNMAKQSDSEDCAVCGTRAVLTPEWAEHAIEQIEELRARAAGMVQLGRDLSQRRTALLSHLQRPSSALGALNELIGVDGSELLTAWTEFAAPGEGLPEDPAELAAHVSERCVPVIELGERLKEKVALRERERASVWQPLAIRILAWLPGARNAQELAPVINDLKAVKAWLDDTAIDLRNERFAPIRDQVTRYWELMRAKSNVEISEMEFAGRGTQRRLDLSVTVDDAPSQALAVMSQGELHSLALCLFLPRATSDQSPFRFVAIDDPVQAMDPARVDGLAEVLDTAAADRQIVVFTHDDRLPEACRRLEIAARVIEVERGANSLVTTRDVSGPVEQYLEDAQALLSTKDAPAEVTERVVPLLCRMSLDARCVEVFRRRALQAGTAHESIEQILADNPKLVPRLALALFNDAAKANDVYPSIQRRTDLWGPDHVKACNKGSHKGLRVDLGEMVNRARKLNQAIS